MLGSHNTASRTYITREYSFRPTEAGYDAGRASRTLTVRSYTDESLRDAATRAVRNVMGPGYYANSIASEPGRFYVTRPMDNVTIGYLTEQA